VAESNVMLFPRWKSDATPLERVSELESYARKYPEWFSRVVVVYVKEGPDGQTSVNCVSAGTKNCLETIGMLENAKQLVSERNRQR
jgi:hypothetical protein